MDQLEKKTTSQSQPSSKSKNKRGRKKLRNRNLNWVEFCMRWCLEYKKMKYTFNVNKISYEKHNI